MLNQHHPVLNSLDTYIQPLITSVLETDKLVFHSGSARSIIVNAVRSSCGKQKGDRFVISIPYARQQIAWNVYFDSQCPEMGPDFVFNDESFLADLSADSLSTEVPSLVKWNPNNKDALIDVLSELLLCYKKYQIQLIEKHERLQFEYKTLLESTKIKTEDVEILMLPAGPKPEARFLISLSVDLSKLRNRNHLSETDAALLIITYYGPDWLNIVPQLQLSKALEELLGGSNNLQIPPFPPAKILFDYVPEIKKFIADKVNRLMQCHEKRADFITTVIQRCAVLEYDACDFRYIVVWMEKSDFLFTMSIHLRSEFPSEMPKVVLQSVYHFETPGTLYHEQFNEFNYHPRWSSERMVDEIMEYIMKSAVNKFKQNSLKRSC